MTKNALLLGVVFSEIKEASRGQGFRDRVRCEALETCGYNVYSLDNKHDESLAKEGKHCQANFSDCRRMMSSINRIWSDSDVLKDKFNTIILDYFFSPAGWARERWTDPFFEKTLPLFAKSDLLAEDGSIWLPHLEVVDELLEQYSNNIKQYYDIVYVNNPKENPLYKATENVTDTLRECPDNLTNETQMKPYLDFSDTPFICLQRKKKSNSTPTKKQKPNGTNLRQVLDAESPQPKKSRRN